MYVEGPIVTSFLIAKSIKNRW